MGCEQVIYSGVILNSKILKEVDSPGVVDCSRQACSIRGTLCYTYNYNTGKCKIYETNEGLILPNSTTNIMSISEDPDDISGFFSES